MRYFSTFSGVGGFEIALDGHECVGFSEVDKYAIQVYQHHFPDHHNYGDITKINWQSVPDFDLLVGGSPCQDLSVAGKQQGLDGKRSGLFWDYVKALEIKKPAHFVWENVKGALSSNEGRDFAEIINAFSEAGYSLWWQVLNAKDFGVPQNRERVFVLGTRNGSPREVFFETGGGRSLDFVGGIESKRKYWLNDGKNFSRNFPQGQRVYSSEGISAVLASQAGGLGAKTGLYVVPVLTPDRLVKRQNGRRFKEDGEEMFTLNTQDKHGIFDGTRIRRLTPIECERLMSWPDNWTKYGKTEKGVVEISDSQRYKMCGNGVVSNVVKEIVMNLLQ